MKTHPPPDWGIAPQLEQHLLLVASGMAEYLTIVALVLPKQPENQKERTSTRTKSNRLFIISSEIRKKPSKLDALLPSIIPELRSSLIYFRSDPKSASRSRVPTRLAHRQCFGGAASYIKTGTGCPVPAEPLHRAGAVSSSLAFFIPHLRGSLRSQRHPLCRSRMYPLYASFCHG